MAMDLLGEPNDLSRILAMVAVIGAATRTVLIAATQLKCVLDKQTFSTRMMRIERDASANTLSLTNFTIDGTNFSGHMTVICSYPSAVEIL